MSAPVSKIDAAKYPRSVLEFAARNGLTDLLDSLRQALDQLFPRAHTVELRVDEDPEIEGERCVVFDVQVSRLDVADFAAAKRRWHDELFRLCPAPLVCFFRLNLVRVS